MTALEWWLLIGCVALFIWGMLIYANNCEVKHLNKNYLKQIETLSKDLTLCKFELAKHAINKKEKT